MIFVVMLAENVISASVEVRFYPSLRDTGVIWISMS